VEEEEGIIGRVVKLLIRQRSLPPVGVLEGKLLIEAEQGEALAVLVPEAAE